MFKEGDVLIAVKTNAQIKEGHIYKVRGRSKTDEGDWVYALNDELAPDKLVHAMGHNFILLTESEPFGGYDCLVDAPEDLLEYYPEKIVPSIYEIRAKGVAYCKTDGSDHYKGSEDEIEPIEFAIQNGLFEDFAVVNIIKYASRFKKDRNLKDLKKVADYAHILCGVELMKED